ncbi:LysR substrate-binding domain-containing protein [Gordonia crocea]|uniref:LysR substrate-binding domain-containing protein n=1 Tax=Gordonia crocea TaxID=589162 RepID=UPI00225E4950|nr:LysR substrate-binding domain-containing protein [Gordonia crocea]
MANPSSYDLRRRTEEWCATAGFEPSIAIEVTEFGTARDFVSRDLGVALLPLPARRFPGVVDVPLRGDGYARTVALATTMPSLSPIARRFRDFVVERGISGLSVE